MRMILTSFVAALLIALPAEAQTIHKLTVQNVGAALTTVGFRYVETTDNRGFPLMRVETGSTIAAQNLNVLFYGCNGLGECEDITLWSWYTTRGPVDDEFVHVWNDVFRQARNWSRAYVDEDGDVVLAMHINATGGIGPDALQILVNTYLAEAADFGTFIGAQ